MRTHEEVVPPDSVIALDDTRTDEGEPEEHCKKGDDRS